ncbi:hypothetical protein A1O3_04259 [Capronia epimyces CBS 606.96]|uniref:ABM domain-containing protein n=1 Tax=Capronia epimyces CBS 606.96 TaxID=1182542 RepID=W9YCA0_9EURO|nr:uncharacterized protein A1O3_04259 [Capronia epimyces CBS 606.96]EXJ87300.1 hypothetical protein A1O3_04259 [Capronia epimyces CBS 606.96]
MASPFKTTQTTLYVTIRVDPSNIEPFLAALRPCWEAVCREPECLYFDISHSPSEPGTFHFVEVWAMDKKTFLEHQLKKPYYEPYEAATRPMWLTERKLEFLARVDGWSYVDSAYLAGSVQT